MSKQEQPRSVPPAFVPISFSYSNGDVVASPTIIIEGYVSDVKGGVITFSNGDFPKASFEVNENGYYRAIVHVAPGLNEYTVDAFKGVIDEYGQAELEGEMLQTAELAITFKQPNIHKSNKPIHMCIILGKDSDGTYDMPGYKLKRGEVANLDTAIKKLKVAGRLIQAFTHEEMRRGGFGNRTFQFSEESTSLGIFESSENYNEVKVYVLRSPKLVAEIRDPNLVQRNPHATDPYGLFLHASELIRNSPELNIHKPKNSTLQCSVLYLDSKYDPKTNLILGSNAMGGPDELVSFSIRGSQGLHSWPNTFKQVTPSFLDQTVLSNEVANHRSGSSWECLNVTLGEFMSAFGQLLGCPSGQGELGVMGLEYKLLNKSFMTRQAKGVRAGQESFATKDHWLGVCHWTQNDLTRFLHHGSFSLPEDRFPKIEKSKLEERETPTPALYATPDDTLIAKSDSGIFMIELLILGFPLFTIANLPPQYYGSGDLKVMNLRYKDCNSLLVKSGKKVDSKFNLRVCSFDGEILVNDFKKYCSDFRLRENIINSHFGLGRGRLTGYKSSSLGTPKYTPMAIGIDVKNITKIRVYHGAALDGVRFYYTSSREPDIIGKENLRFTDVLFNPGEYITKFNIRNGEWIDAIQFQTNQRISPMIGGKGGHLSSLEAPEEYAIVGMYGFCGSWLDAIGIVYAKTEQKNSEGRTSEE